MLISKTKGTNLTLLDTICLFTYINLSEICLALLRKIEKFIYELLNKLIITKNILINIKIILIIGNKYGESNYRDIC